MILAPFRKQNTCTNSRKDGKFGTDLVDSMLNTIVALEFANVSQLFRALDSIAMPSEEQILVNDLWMIQSWHYVTREPECVKLIKELCFLKEQVLVFEYYLSESRFWL